MKRVAWGVLGLAVLVSLACSTVSGLLGGEGTPSPTPPAPTAAPASTSVAMSPSPPPAPGGTGQPPQTGERRPEAIAILSPGPRSEVTSPLHVEGIADPTFEMNLAVQIVGEDGAIVATGHATINGGGEFVRGPFMADVEFTLPGSPQGGRLVIYSASARDGHLTHLASVPVRLLPSGGPASIQTAEERPEQITITAPAGPTDSGVAVVSGGRVHVEGAGFSPFEQTLAVVVCGGGGSAFAPDAVCGATDNVVGQGTATIQGEAGKPGPFSADVAYAVSGETPGSVLVYAVSAGDGSIVHLASVDVTLQP